MTQDSKAWIIKTALCFNGYLLKLCFPQERAMPKKSLLLNSTTFEHFAGIHKAMRSDPLKPFLTKTQGDAIAHGVDETIGFPASIALEQRTPKGTVYVFEGADLAFLIDQRGTFLRSRRSGIKTSARRKILVTL